MKSWRTTISGILTIVAALATAGIMVIKTGTVSAEVLTTVGTALATGIGLIKAADQPKAGE